MGEGLYKGARSKYPGGQYETTFDFIKGIYASKGGGDNSGCVVRARGIHAGNVERAGGWEMGGHTVLICHQCILLLFLATFLIRSSRHSSIHPLKSNLTPIAITPIQT